MMKKLLILLISGSSLLMPGLVSGQPGCPGIDAGSNQTVTCATPCATLNANPLATGLTNTYSVSSIPYNPPYPYSTGTPISVGTDDVWSSLITLPFTFCFYGNSYTQIVAGSNGVISFNAAYASGYCPYSFSVSCPSASLPLNAIFGVYHDIDPAVGGNMYYAILGTYPCRTFVVNYNNIPMYSCTSIRATHQIVLYESTNVIEVYIANKPLCSGWNSGNAIVGIQDAAGTTGITAPGRNTTPTWTASNEAWRFTPAGAPNYSVTWWNGGTQIATGTSVQVCPTTTTTYTAQVEYQTCFGTPVIETDQVTITSNNTLSVSVNPVSTNSCPGDPVNLSASSNDPTTTYEWSNTQTGSSISVNPTVTTSYTVTGTASNGCQSVAISTVNVYSGSTITVTPSAPGICQGGSVTMTASNGSNFTWSPATGLSGTSGPVVTATPSASITYTVSGNNNNGCPDFALVPFNVIPSPLISAGADTTICTGGSAQLEGSGGLIYNWSPATGLSATDIANPVATPAVNTTYTLTAYAANGSVLANGDFESGNTGFTSSYIYSPTIYNENYYYITNNPQSWHPGFNTCPDHTTGSGNMMVINGSNVPNTDLWCTTVSVVPNTDYAFSCWLQSVHPTSPAILQFSINGSLFGPVFNANPVACIWDQFYEVWNSGSNTTATICIVNQNTTLSGNDFAIDDISFSPLCPGTDYVTVSISNPSASTTVTDAACYNGSDGTATANLTGGVSPYTYVWSTSPAQTGQTATGLSAGSYSVTVTDDAGCTASSTASVGEPTELLFNLVSTSPALCFGGSTGSASVTASGATPPYSYAWSYGSSTGPNAGGFPAGNYSVTVTDDNNCTASIPFTITQPPVISIILDALDEGCLGSCTGSLSASVSGGHPPYFYQWSGSSSVSPSISNLCAGNYTVSVTDSNGCLMTQSGIVGTNTLIDADASAFPLVGLIPLDVNFSYDGYGAGLYFWDFGDGSTSTLMNPEHTYTDDGTFTITLTVSSGAPDSCVDVFTFTIMAYRPSSIFIPNIATPNDDGINDDFLVKSESLQEEQMVIYNRWGRKVFEWNEIGGKWDCKKENGGDIANGTYFFVFYARGNDGVEYNKNGTLTILK